MRSSTNCCTSRAEIVWDYFGANAELDMLVVETNPDARARQTEEQMTDAERFSLLVSVIGASTPDLPRLDVPALRSTDGNLDTQLPASILIGATFNPALARQGGALIGREARVHGFN